MPKKNEKKEKAKKKARKKAVGLAAVATAAAVAPQAAEVIVQKAAEPQVVKAPEVEIPQPPRYEYSKPRPLKTIGDLLKGVLGIGTARAQSADTGYIARPQPRLPKIPTVPAPGQTIAPRLPTYDTKPGAPPSGPSLTQPPSWNQPGTTTPPPSTVLPTPPSPADSEVAVGKAKEMLRSFLDLTEEQAQNISIVRVEAVQWGDPSLGLPEEGMGYQQVVTPGMRITLQYADRFYVYHTNLNGTTVKFASQSDADPGPLEPGTRVLPTPPEAPVPLPDQPPGKSLPREPIRDSVEKSPPTGESRGDQPSGESGGASVDVEGMRGMATREPSGSNVDVEGMRGMATRETPDEPTDDEPPMPPG